MAIINNSIKKNVEDENNNIKIGIDYPVHLNPSGSDGYFQSTNTTIDAVKNNIRNLLKTQKNERLMQPTLGLNLKKYLFEQYTNDLEDIIKNEIVESFNFWLPFVQIINLNIIMDDTEKNTMNITVDFNINKNSNSFESIEVSIGD
tara:strand:+ start:27 stop:464 length:438 start_codon:yes stop_codon:yes gene_type:complete